MTKADLEPFNRAGGWLEEAGIWRKRRQEFDKTVGEIRIALLQKSDWRSVLELHHHLLGFPEFEIPGDVTEQYAEWAGSRRRLRVIFAGLALIAILSGVVLYLAILRD